jgi:hypothetical protein
MRDFIEDNYSVPFGWIQGFDDCIIGVSECSMKIIYSIPLCIDLIYRLPQIESREKAEIYFYEYIFNGYYNERNAPIFANHPSESVDYWLN